MLGAVRTLPLPDWSEQPKIRLAGNAVVTRDISVITTGQGNAARELRVQGRDADGRYGYYFKPIFSDEWNFKATSDGFYEADVIHRYGEKPVLGRVLEKSYRGKLSQTFKPGIEIELIGFHYFDSPATLRAHVGNKTFDMILHTVDAWGPTTQNLDPDLIGNPNGEPKLLQGTLEIPDPLLQSSDPEIIEALKTYFLRFNLVPFAIELNANDERVEIGTVKFERDSTRFMDYRMLTPSWEAQLANSAGMLAPEEVLTGYFFAATDPGLVVDDFEFTKSGDAQRLALAIERNKSMLKSIRILRRAERKEYAKNGLTAAIVSAAFYAVANPLINIISLPSYQETVGNVMLRGGGILPRYAIMNLKQAFSSQADYDYSTDLIERRIHAYEAQLRGL